MSTWIFRKALAMNGKRLCAQPGRSLSFLSYQGRLLARWCVLCPRIYSQQLITKTTRSNRIASSFSVACVLEIIKTDEKHITYQVCAKARWIVHSCGKACWLRCYFTGKTAERKIGEMSKKNVKWSVPETTGGCGPALAYRQVGRMHRQAP